ncbi:MAG TPA: VTT domain-containing protein [bacterium]|nr:VTT domain-containing protein [bacterium]
MEQFWGLLEHYGLWALAIGAFFQGYTLVILAGLFVSQRLLDGSDVILVSAVSAWIGHWFFYGVGRWLHRRRHYVRNPRINRQLNSLNHSIDIHPWIAVFFTQYGYGVRILGAVAFGLSRVRKSWFAVAQSLNCAIWAAVLFAVGYGAGIGLFEFSGNACKSGLMAATAACAAVMFIRRRRRLEPECIPVLDESVIYPKEPSE